MSNVFEFEGIDGMGYSQPDLLIEKSKLKLPAELLRKKLPRLPLLTITICYKGYSRRMTLC